GLHAVRELVELPAAQARRGSPAGRGRARGDVLLPDPRPSGVRRPASLQPFARPRPDRDGARRRPSARAVRLPHDGRGARLRPLLPERFGGRAPVDGCRGRAFARVDPQGVGGARARSARAAGEALSGIRVANAPCSFGAFEITVGVLPNVPGAEEVLAATAETGYEGTELGPPGYLGDTATLHGRLERHGLALAGGYIPIRFSKPSFWEDDLAGMSLTLDLFDAADGDGARPVLADAGSPERLADPGRGTSLDEAGWERLAEGVARAAELARGRGHEPTFP